MAKLWQNLANLLEYIGLRSPSYFHTVPEVNYDPDDPAAYYVDFEARANYPGPFDATGLPQMTIESDRVIFPTQLAIYALGCHERYRKNGGVGNLNQFRKAVYWLLENQEADGAWLLPVRNRKYQIEPPYRSAMVQGLAISVLVRAAMVFESDRFIESATKGLRPYSRAVGENGVATLSDEGIFYEEYPCDPPRHVLNGFIFAIWGLYDLMRANDNQIANRLWNDGIATLIKWLPEYDIGYWSRYQLPREPRNPATVPYHRLHVNQMTVMAELSDDPVFAEYRDRWAKQLRNRFNAIRTLPAKLRWVNSSGF